MKPTLEEVKEYFKDAEIVGSIYYEHTHFQPDLSKGLFTGDDINGYSKDGITYSLWSPEHGYAKILTYKTPKFEITKEQVLELHHHGHDLTKTQLGDIFPEFFENDLVVGRWITKDEEDCLWIVYISEKNELYGINLDGVWFKSVKIEETIKAMLRNPENRYATPQEVESALIGEAKKRGYRDGDFVTPLWETPYTKWSLIGNNFRFENGKLYLSSCIFKDGIWATIIPDETFTKPLLSLNDLLSVWSEDNDTEFYKTSRLFKSFEKLAKSKI